jgi:plasmid segregation protein ParM
VRDEGHDLEEVGGEKSCSYKDTTGRYMVGNDALITGEFNRPSTDSSYPFTQNYRVQGLWAMEQLLGCELDSKGKLPKDLKQVSLVTGLPVEFYKKDKDKLAKEIRSWKSRFIDIVNVSILPQPIGTLMDVMTDWDGTQLYDFKDKRIIIIDIGDGTIDAIEVLNNNPTKNYGGASNGVSQMFGDIRSKVRAMNPKFNDATIEQAEMREIIETGKFFFYGEEKDISQLVAKSKQTMAQSVVSLIDGIWPKRSAIRKIIVTGGGAAVLKEELKNVIPEGQLIIQDDPEMSNAIGFAKMAALKYGK